jgi:hypothetical protein
MKTSRKNILTIVAAALVIGGGFYYFFFMTDSSADTVIPGGAPASQAEISFITLVSQLGPITFDTSILSSPNFTSLVDIRTAVVAEPQGRTDPFGPLGR